jgi:xanthine dehydrogenase YagT iron-sulfur-binding subunit
MEKQTYSRRFFLSTSSMVAALAFIPDSIKAFYQDVKKRFILSKSIQPWLCYQEALRVL